MAQVVMSLLNASAVGNPLANAIAKPDWTTAPAGNPFVDGWYADPDVAIYQDEYWVFPTYSDAYEKQTFMDAFSSPDLVNWTKHPNILTIDNVKWANKAVWAPAPVARNGRYFLYFAANDIQEDEDQAGAIGGIGVAVADNPQGPYIDAIGKPLIGHYYNAAQPIDQGVFIDDDGQAYMYYGGHSHANVAKLNEDMISIGAFDDGTQFKEITPVDYVEGSLMIKRNGTYYFMWSEGGWMGSDYSVAYAMTNSPTGPFSRKGKILQEDPAVAKGCGHHGIINVPGTDIWYIVYHRRPLSETAANHRVLAYDRMYFNDDGTIAPVKLGVEDNFADGNAIGWKSYGGDWSVVDQRLTISGEFGGLAMLDTQFGNLTFDATIALPRADGQRVGGEAGLLFRASNITSPSMFVGYFAAISPAGNVSLKSLSASGWEVLQSSAVAATSGEEYKVRVIANGPGLQVFVDDLETPKISVNVADGNNIITGATGVGAFGTAARFGYVSNKGLSST
ncbi:hypothetical protein JX266_012335 [Neoarthrinium moseri]|nr:hypothetical protein JX266_012335 [Neoarthrinium moseri]